MADDDTEVEVTVTTVDGKGEAVVYVPKSIALQGIIEVLAEKLRRPDMVNPGVTFVKILHSGNVMHLPDVQKLGNRRTLLILGTDLEPAPEELPPLSLDDFDEFDPEMVVGSPRSVQACQAEGLLPEDLTYKPPKFYAQRGLPKRIVMMRYNFFEAFRQDALLHAREARDILMEAQNQQAGSSSSSTSKAVSAEESVAGIGGLWSGPLEPCRYDHVKEFFLDLHEATTNPRGGKLFEHPLKLPDEILGSGRRPDKYKPAMPKAPDRSIIPGNELLQLGRTLGNPNKANQDCVKVQHMLNKLKKLPYGKDKGATLNGVLLRTESTCCVQRLQNAQRLDRMHAASQQSISRKVEMAEAQKDHMEKQQKEETQIREVVEKNHSKNRSEWKTGLQEENFKKAAARSDHWQKRRDEIQQRAMDAEKMRNSQTKKLHERDTGKDKGVQNLRDLQKNAYAKKWLDRRMNWARSAAEVRKNKSDWENSVSFKRDEADARIEDQKLRIIKWVEVVRELKGLRKDFQDMVNERENRRQNCRRVAIAEELQQMALEADEQLAAVLGDASPGASAAALDPSASVYSQSSPDATKRSGMLWMSGGSFGSTMSTTAASSPTGGGKLPKLRGVPRFDFPRVASEVMSPLALTMGSFSPSMSYSASDPSFNVVAVA
eukprot:TRINITY_DN26323_c0_g1_i1.p1 TRINITY_DN26323_c0_g1~~TRINITY_DN26323_c0_g1_i1.p1  ORF type:complete len:660 (+),score=209.76 TRINITY_DN26323_c0_g1_i1:143-2122(+)